MKRIILLFFITLVLLTGCGAVQLNSITREARTAQNVTDATKFVTVPEGMVWYDSPQRAHALRFPPGHYTLEAEDADYWYLRSPAPLEFRDFAGGQTTDTRNVPGGLMLAKRFSMLPGAGYIKENGQRIMVWKLGGDFLQLEGKAWKRNF